MLRSLGKPETLMAKKKKKKAKSKPKTGDIQTVIVKKTVAPTRADAKRLVKDHFKKRTYTSRETPTTWRFRQRPPDCFKPKDYGQKCIPIRGVKNGVCLVYATLKRGARKRKSCR